MSAFGDIKDGYPGLAKVMGPNSDQGFGIYKCFAELNARNLLMMQAELLGLEEELKTLTFLDESCPDPTRKAFARNVWRMRNTKNSEQWAKVLEIREKLQAYNQCLLQQAQLARLGKVNMYDLRLLIHWLEHQDGGNQFLQKFEQSVWDEQNIRDLVSISGRDPRDGFLRWFHQKLLPNLHHRIIELWREPMPGAEGTDLSRTNGNLLTSLSRFVNVALSSLIPVMAVLVLYTIERLPNRLYAVAGFSVVFSLTLAIFTTARPIEIFTATAAFASVQVVFVGGTNNSEATGQCPCVQ